MAPGQDRVKVLALLRVLYDHGAVADLQQGDLVEALAAAGIRGFSVEEEPLYLAIGEVLHLLLRDTRLGAEAAFDAAKADLACDR